MTEHAKDGPKGQIAVRVESDYVFLQSTPIDVRDSKLRLVAKASGSRMLDLPVGLYEVSAVLEDGRRHSTLVQVNDGERSSIRLAALPTGRLEEPAVEESNLPPIQQPGFTRGVTEAIYREDPYREVGETAAKVQLLGVFGAVPVRESRTHWTFQGTSNVNVVPNAWFQIGLRQWRISLPISSSRLGCTVKFERVSTGFHASAWISPERTVANALQNLLSSGYLIEGARVAVEAVELLRDKYRDPAGAALGALLLHKVGQLHRWESWVVNLVRDFDWLPDGKVLLAQLRYERESASGEVLSLLLAASRQRMMYSESYSLLLDLLRRWPRSRSWQERQGAVLQLAEDAPYIDWESICLSQSISEGDR